MRSGQLPKKRPAAVEELRQLGFARLDRFVPEIAAIKVQEIEHAVDRRIVVLAPAKQLEIREPVRVACDQLAVDDAGADRKRIDGRDDRRKPITPIEPAPRDEADALAVMMGEHAVAIMLDLMQPFRAARRGRG